MWLLLTTAVAWLIYLKIVPTGEITYVNDFHGLNYFIGKLTPLERVVASPGLTLIKGEPAYFSLRPPRKFNQAKVTVKFKNRSDLPLMEIGLLNDKVAANYDLKPLTNKTLDQLSLVWQTVAGGGVKLIEREKKYDSVEQFLKNLPPNREIALYNYSLKNNFLLPDYKPTLTEKAVNVDWRGAYQFYTYVKNEDLNYVFNFLDLNLNKDDDPIEIKVYSPDGLIYSETVIDTIASLPERRAAIKLPGLTEGVYRLSITANNDIITKKITSSQSYLVLINKVWLAGGSLVKVLYTDSRQVSAETINPASLGQIKVGAGVINLNQTYRQFSVVPGKDEDSETSDLTSKTKIELDKDDIMISGDGLFSLTPDFFSPGFKKVNENSDINGEGINYILTSYESPITTDGWQTATAEFDLTRAYQENGKYQFLISLPGLKLESSEAAITAGQAAGVEISEIKVALTGKSLWQKLKEIF